MRIAIIVTLFPPKWLAGTELATYNVAKYLAQEGHEIHVVTSQDDRLPLKEVKEDINIHRIAFRKIPIICTISFWHKIYLEIKKINPDVVHVQSIEIGLPAYFSKKILKRSYVVWGQGTDVYYPKKTTRLISKIILKNADVVIALTEHMKKEMLKIYERNVVIIPNGIDLDKFTNVRANVRDNRDEKRIIFVGTLRSIKGIKYLIEAMESIRKNCQNTKLIIVGDGEEREQMELLVKELSLDDCISFIGRVTNEEIPRYMKRADVFVLPSLSEGLPLVILEAMATGLPIVATSVGGIPYIIKDKINGYLVEPKNAKDIAEKVTLILNDNELKEEMSRNNLISIKEYSWKKVVKKLICVYKKI